MTCTGMCGSGVRTGSVLTEAIAWIQRGLPREADECSEVGAGTIGRLPAVLRVARMELPMIIFATAASAFFALQNHTSSGARGEASGRGVPRGARVCGRQWHAEWIGGLYFLFNDDWKRPPLLV